MKLQVIIDPVGRMTVSAIDLTGDTWNDYLYYLNEAGRFDAGQDTQGKTVL